MNTGEVITGGLGRRGMFATSDAVVLGDAVNVAARLEQAARPGEVLIGESTYRLVREAARVEAVAPMEAKGKSDPVVAYRLLDLEAPVVLSMRAPDAARRAGPGARRARTRVRVGRGRAVVPARDRRRRARSREVEAGRRADRSHRHRARAVRGGCLAYGEGITYWAIAQIVRDLAGVRRRALAGGGS